LNCGSDAVIRFDPALQAAAGRQAAPSPEVLFPKSLFNRMPPMYIADRQGRFTLISPEFEQFLTYGFGVERKASGDIDAQEELLGVLRHLEKGVNEIKLRRTVNIGTGVRHYRSFHVRTVEGGIDTGYAGIYTDVTLEAEAVIEAARTESRFQDIIRSGSD